MSGTQVPSHRRLDLFAGVAVLLAAAWLVTVNLWNVGNPIVEMHAFRQTQTALTAKSFLTDGFRLAYETPVLGEPWSIPFEFPLFQALVAVIAGVTGASLTVVGRLVSLAFTLACSFPLYAALRRLDVARHGSLLAVAAFLSAPIYVFWSGTFMIESAALFFALAFIWLTVRLGEGDWGPGLLLAWAVALALALLQKATTVLPVLPVAVVYLLVRHFQRKRPLREAVVAGVVFAIAFAVGGLWVLYADAIKMQHPIGYRLASNAPLMVSWNYGTLAQRFSEELWRYVAFGRVMAPTDESLLGIVALAIGVVFARGRMRVLIALLLALFVLPFFVFTNLHVQHNYYQCANAVFWAVAVGLALSVLMERWEAKNARWALVLVAAVLAANASTFLERFDVFKFTRFDTRNHATLAAAEFIRSHTPADRPIVWVGMDWSSEGPFYADRKALAVPSWPGVSRDVLTHLSRHLSREPSALVYCRGISWAPRDPLVMQLVAGHPAKTYGNCEVYLLLERGGPGAEGAAAS